MLTGNVCFSGILFKPIKKSDASIKFKQAFTKYAFSDKFSKRTFSNKLPKEKSTAVATI